LLSSIRYFLIEVRHWLAANKLPAAMLAVKLVAVGVVV
jgi:hypothetical protein